MLVDIDRHDDHEHRHFHRRRTSRGHRDVRVHRACNETRCIYHTNVTNWKCARADEFHDVRACAHRRSSAHGCTFARSPTFLLHARVPPTGQPDVHLDLWQRERGVMAGTSHTRLARGSSGRVHPASDATLVTLHNYHAYAGVCVHAAMPRRAHAQCVHCICLQGCMPAIHTVMRIVRVHGRHVHARVHAPPH